MGSIADYIADLKVRFSAAEGWDARMKLILALSEGLPAMDPARKCEETRFHGCQSQVWLDLGWNRIDGVVEVQADSDARVMRGLLAIAVGLYHGRRPQDIAAHPPDLLIEAGLVEAMAPNRANGVYRLLRHVHAYGAALAAHDPAACPPRRPDKAISA